MSHCHYIERYNYNIMFPGRLGIDEWILKPGVNYLIEVLTINNLKDIYMGAHNTLVTLMINY